jgi:diguanylate cyclase (GGDEF)-like protein/PAS domain S-box-containing protein
MEIVRSDTDTRASFPEELRARMREVERRAFEAEAKYEALLSQLPAAIYAYSPQLDGPTYAMSPFVEELLGVPAEVFLENDHMWDELIHPDDRERSRLDYESYLRTGHPDAGDYRYVRPDGRAVWVRDRSATIRDADGTPMFIQGVMFDVTATKEAELRMQHIAYHDVLTGLPNRTMLEEHLELALARARRDDLAVAVVFLDLDAFKFVNDTHGHSTGDEVLRQVAARLRAAVRDTDLVARQGGDGFMVLVADLEPGSFGEAARSTVARVIERIGSSLSQPLRLQVGELTMSVSIGSALYPDDTQNGQELLRQADDQMYERKRNRRDRPSVLRRLA